MSYQVIHGDCLAILPTLDAESVDAVVTDPPYGLEFMGKEWDRLSGQPGYVERGRITKRPDSQVPYGRGGGVNSYQAGKPMQEWHERWAREVYRVLKPGGHLLAFGGTRTYHRMACAVEDAGFEIRDSIMWLYGSGFPKSKNVALAIDKAQGHPNRGHRIATANRHHPDGTLEPNGDDLPAYEGKSDEAKRWAGWGTALKPGHEPIVVARKPLIGTVERNVREHGTGALNIDGCRLDGTKPHREVVKVQENDGQGGGAWKSLGVGNGISTEGRWPANVILDEDAAAELDATVAPTKSRVGKPRGSAQPGDGWGMTKTGAEYDDAGGPSRFFYTPKASRSERNAGLEGLDERPLLWSSGTQNPGSFQAEGTKKAAQNAHPTVKPIALMRWLVRLVTPPGGLVLDPFTGSGTTGCACVLEGFRFLGIEQDEHHADVARRRIRHWGGPLFTEVS